MARIGVFVCHCGTNIAGTVNIPAVIEAVRQIPMVTHVEDSKYMCSDPGQSAVRDAIIKNRLNRVVIAACSPRMHENTFRKAVSAAGLNPYLLEICNIREHCSWVHNDAKESATEKAIELIKMAVAKAARNEELFPKQLPVTKRTLVIGGGISGIQAALDIANSGYEVVLVERESTIGGRMAQLDKTFPTLDCSSCILTPKMVEVAQHPKITLLTYAEVKEVKGFVGNFEVNILQKTRKVDHTKCTGCGSCWQKCPEEVDSEFNLGLGKRPTIHIPFAQAIPSKPVIDTGHCRYIKYLQFIAEGREGKPPPQCRICEKICPTGAIDWEQKDKILTEKVGAIVVATGYQPFDPAGYTELGSERYPDVITSIEMERMMSASGPTGGKVSRLSNGEHPKEVVFLTCIGSRDVQRGRSYCSKVCCMHIAKQAIMLKEHDPEVQCYVFYMDVRTVSKDYEEFYKRAQESGTVYIRGKVAAIRQENGKLIVRGEDTLLGEIIEVPADLVVLAIAMERSPGAADLARTIKISYDANDLFNEAHPKLRPVETMTDGIFVAGVCVGPRDIPESVASGSAAAAKVAALFSRDYISSDPIVAAIDQIKCSGCLLCIKVCPFKAIDTQVTRDGRTVAVVNEVLCKGCGLCVAACRFGAPNLRGFNQQQLLAEVTSLWQ